MGLRTLAYYLDRTEAVVVQSVLLDAGILAVIGNEDMLRLRPSLTLALGGYRILVSDFDIDYAADVLNEALENPIAEGGVLIVTGNFFDRIASLAWGWLAGGAPSPIRGYEWRE